MIIKRFINGKPVEEIVNTPQPPAVTQPKKTPTPPAPKPIPPSAPARKGCGCGRK